MSMVYPGVTGRPKLVGMMLPCAVESSVVEYLLADDLLYSQSAPRRTSRTTGTGIIAGAGIWCGDARENATV